MNILYKFIQSSLLMTVAALSSLQAQDITGNWYLSEFEYERSRGGSASTSSALNLELSVDALGDNQYRIEVTG